MHYQYCYNMQMKRKSHILWLQIIRPAVSMRWKPWLHNNYVLIIDHIAINIDDDTVRVDNLGQLLSIIGPKNTDLRPLAIL